MLALLLLLCFLVRNQDCRGLALLLVLLLDLFFLVLNQDGRVLAVLIVLLLDLLFFDVNHAATLCVCMRASARLCGFACFDDDSASLCACLRACGPMVLVWGCVCAGGRVCERLCVCGCACVLTPLLLLTIGGLLP